MINESQNNQQSNQKVAYENLFKRVPVKVFSDPIWINEQVFSKKEAYIDLFSLAYDSYKNNCVDIPIRESLVRIYSGQVAMGLRALSIRWKWSTKKVNNFIKELEKLDYINIIKRHPVTIFELKDFVHRIRPKRNAIETKPSQALDMVATEA